MADVFSKLAKPNDAVVRIQSENTGPIANSGVLLASGFTSALDVRKTSDVGPEAFGPGGIAAIYVQHRASGITAGTVTAAIRGQMATTQSRTGGAVNDSCGAYFTINNGGHDCGGFGVHVDMLHGGTGANVTTYGVSSEMFRSSSFGRTVGVHVRTMGMHDTVNDVGVLVSKGGQIAGHNDARVVRAFAAGSDEITGQLTCDYGVDLHAATCDVAAVVIGAGRKIMLDGLTPTADIYFDAMHGTIEFANAGFMRHAVQMATGTIYVSNGKDGKLYDRYLDLLGQGGDAILSMAGNRRLEPPVDEYRPRKWINVRVDDVRYAIPLYL